MNTYFKPIKMIASFAEDGTITPIRWQIVGKEGENITIPVDRVLLRTVEKVAADRMIIFRCQSVINNLQRVYEIKYETSKCIWWLWKM